MGLDFEFIQKYLPWYIDAAILTVKVAFFGRLFFMICVNTENGIKYRIVIGLVRRKVAYCP